MDLEADGAESAEAKAHFRSIAATWRVMAAQSLQVDKLVAGLLGNDG